MVETGVNRELSGLLLWAAAGAISAAPAAARAVPKDGPKRPVVAIEGIHATGLLSTVEEEHPSPSLRLSIIDADRAGLLEQPAWRIERDGNPVTGKRAKLSLPVGSTTVFALGGKLTRRTGSTLPDPVEGPSPLASRKMDSGRVYGAGVERHVGRFDLSATYQYSRISRGEAGDSLSDGHAKSHSLQASARIRFRR
jgi:hypothetical protein